MAKINLRDIYKEYELDCFIEIADGDEDAFIAELTKEIADVYVEYQRAENAYERRTYYHKAHYSMNVGDGIENDAINCSRSPEEIFFDKFTQEQIRSAISALSQPQNRRVEAHYIHGISVADIALSEGVTQSRVYESISRGLRNMKNILKNF